MKEYPNPAENKTPHLTKDDWNNWQLDLYYLISLHPRFTNTLTKKTPPASLAPQ